MSSAVVETEAAQLAVSDAELEALLAQQEGEFGDDLFQVPILKIGQPLTREVQADEAEPGEFINTLLGEGIGTKIGFIVSYYQAGRFAADRKENRAYVAFGPTIPAAWADLVGEEYVGTPFDEYPDAEEQYKRRVNAKEIEWGTGPLVSTTHNFTGYALVPSPDPDEPDDVQPVRLSLKRTDVPMAKKILTLKKAALRGKPFWDAVFELGTEKKQFTKGVSHLLTVKMGRATTPEERQMAVELATAVAAGRVGDNQAAESAVDKPAEPAAKGGGWGSRVSFLLLIAGLILLLAGSSWFTGAATVGIILTVVGGLWVGLVAAVAVLAIGGARSTRKSIRRDFNDW